MALRSTRLFPARVIGGCEAASRPPLGSAGLDPQAWLRMCSSRGTLAEAAACVWATATEGHIPGPKSESQGNVLPRQDNGTSHPTGQEDAISFCYKEGQ